MARDEAQLLEMGERIRNLRESHGYKQQWIADQVGVQLRTYQFWQAGKSPPAQESLEKLAELFGVTPQYILRGETPDLSREGSESQLDRIEQKLDTILAYWQTVSQDTPDDALAYLQRVTGFMRGVLEPDPPARDTTPAPRAAKGQSRRTRRVA